MKGTYMKKILILSLIFFTTNSFASGINGDTSIAPCDNETLSKYTGTANVEINWEPNVIGLKWYDGDTELNVATASQTCTYDGMITVPPAPPQKLGYTFNGWKIPKMDFGTIPTDANGTERWAIGWHNNANCCYRESTSGGNTGVACNSNNVFTEIQLNEWKVKFSHGELFGVSGCSAISGGTQGQHGIPTIGVGAFCWCKAKWYKANNSSLINGSVDTLSWVFEGSSSIGVCAEGCAISCAEAAEYKSSFRTALFTPAQ